MIVQNQNCLFVEFTYWLGVLCFWGQCKDVVVNYHIVLKQSLVRHKNPLSVLDSGLK